MCDSCDCFIPSCEQTYQSLTHTITYFQQVNFLKIFLLFLPLNFGEAYSGSALDDLKWGCLCGVVHKVSQFAQETFDLDALDKYGTCIHL